MHDENERRITRQLEWAEHLGVGGMGTRGFGRVRKIADWEVDDDLANT